MKNIHEILQQKDTNGRPAILLTDGAMGTYYTEKTGEPEGFSEFANLSAPDLIRSIHMEYINAGAQLIRTNTFAANRFALKVPREEQEEILRQGAAIALEAAGQGNALVAGSIGPIRDGDSSEEEIYREYRFMAKTMFEKGIRIFVFETFSETTHLCRLAGEIKGWDPDVFLHTQFAFSSDGMTRDGHSFARVFKEIADCRDIDGWGLNCGAGPSHLRRLAEQIPKGVKPISVLPNASFPEVINERTVYVNNPTYFASVMEEIAKRGAQIVGGCCGTTPSHIRAMAELLFAAGEREETPEPQTAYQGHEPEHVSHVPAPKPENKGFLLAVEMDPPFDLAINQMIDHAGILKDAGIDLLTIADSPRGIARVDSLMTAALIHRKTGLSVMPHLCCRDKNTNAIRSGLMACHIEGIRNVLAVTGDPILEADKVTTKSVFNLNSFKLIETIMIMNEELCPEEGFAVSAALNLGAPDLEAELSRMVKKQGKGAEMFLTQPIFEVKAEAALADLKSRYNVKCMAGIMPLVSRRNAEFLNNELPGINIPEEYVNRFPKGHTREEGEEIGISLAVEIAERIRPDSDGFYLIIPMARTHVVVEIIRRLREKGLLGEGR